MNKICFVFMLAIITISNIGNAHMPTSESFRELLTQRHSGRSYDANRKVSKEQLQAIIEAGKLAPSSYNEQPWTILIADRHTNQESYDKVFKALVPFNQGWAKDAPILIVITADKRSKSSPPENHWAEYDTGAAAYGMMLEATTLGLMAHQMAGFDPEVLRKEFKIPSHFKPLAVMALGYEKNGEKPLPKERRPSSENFFLNEWEKAAF